MIKVVEKRIKELEKEIREHEKQIGMAKNQLEKLYTTVVSKSGAIVELKKLLPKEGKDES